MFAGTALSVRLLIYAGLSLFIINGPYVYMVVCVVYAYNLTIDASSLFYWTHSPHDFWEKGSFSFPRRCTLFNSLCVKYEYF